MNEQAKINLESLSPQEILVIKNLQDLKSAAYDHIDNLDWDAALDLAKKIEKKFVQFTPANSEEQYAYGIVRYWVLRLKLFTYANLTESERHDLIKNHTVEIVRNGMDLTSYIFRYIDFFNTEKIIKEEARNLIDGLRNSDEILAKDNVDFKKQNFFPSVKNWLNQYQISLNKGKLGQTRPGAFEITSFLTSNQQVRYLSAAEKLVLKSILNFYNWLVNPIVFVETAVKPLPAVPRPPVVPVAPKPSIPPAHGQDLDVLKKRVEQVVPVVKPPSPGPRPPSPKGGGELLMTPQEIKREVSTPELTTHEELELPAHQEGIPSSSRQVGTPRKDIVLPKPVVQAPKPQVVQAPKPVNPSPPAQPQSVQAVPKMNLTTLASISMVDDLKKIEINHLRPASTRGEKIAFDESTRGGQSTYLLQQTQLIKSKIINLAQANRLLPYYTVNAFEQSPLFRAYLSHGQSKFAGSPMTNDLSQAEFEAIADLRKEIERL